MSGLILYQRDYCHLCDLALAVLAEARAPDFDSVWVDDSDALEQLYGTRVPVLRDARDGRELDWPFDAAAVRVFLVGPVGAHPVRDGSWSRSEEHRAQGALLHIHKRCQTRRAFNRLRISSRASRRIESRSRLATMSATARLAPASPQDLPPTR